MNVAEYLVSQMYYIYMEALFTGFAVLSNRLLDWHMTFLN